MPTYDYKCSSCEHIWSEFKKIADRDEPVSSECPNCKETGHIEKILLAAPGLGDPVRLGLMKPDNGFKEVLQKIHEKTPGSTLNSHSSLRDI